MNRRHALRLLSLLLPRCIVLLIITVALLNPQRRVETGLPLPNTLLIMQDTSASNTLARRDHKTHAVLAELQQQAATIPNLKTIFRPFKQTDIVSTLQKQLSILPMDQLAGVIVISDAAWSDTRDALNSLKTDFPIHVVLTDKPEHPDRSLKILQMPSYTAVGKTAAMQVLAHDNQRAAGMPIAATLQTVDGIKKLSLPNRQPTYLSLPVRHQGQQTAVLRLQTDPSELTYANNAVILKTQGLRERAKVLLVSGKASLNTRFLRQLLKNDPGVDLVHFTILRTQLNQDLTPEQELALIPFPVDELFQQRLQQFDLVILDSIEQASVIHGQYLRNIVDAVLGGKSLMMLHGKAMEPYQQLLLQPVLPLQPRSTGFSAVPVPIKVPRNPHPITQHLPLDQLPATLSFATDMSMKTADVILDSKAGGILALQEFSARHGRVAQSVVQDSWHWQRATADTRLATRLYTNIIHWLLHDPAFDRRDWVVRTEGQMLRLVPQQADAAPVTVTMPDGQRKSYISTVAVKMTKPGVYTIHNRQQIQTIAHQLTPHQEWQHLQTVPEKATALVTSSKGAVIGADDRMTLSPPASRHGLLDNSLWLKDRAAMQVQQTIQEPLLPAAAFVLPLLLLLAILWKKSL